MSDPQHTLHSAALQPILDIAHALSCSAALLGQHMFTTAEAHLGVLVLASELQAHILTGSAVQEGKEEWLHCAAFDFSKTELLTAEQKSAE